MSGTPTIEIDDTGSSSSDESDNEEEDNPKKKAHVDGEEILDLLDSEMRTICLNLFDIKVVLMN